MLHCARAGKTWRRRTRRFPSEGSSVCQISFGCLALDDKKVRALRCFIGGTAPVSPRLRCGPLLRAAARPTDRNPW